MPETLETALVIAGVLIAIIVYAMYERKKAQQEDERLLLEVAKQFTEELRRKF